MEDGTFVAINRDKRLPFLESRVSFGAFGISSQISGTQSPEPEALNSKAEAQRPKTPSPKLGILSPKADLTS